MGALQNRLKKIEEKIDQKKLLDIAYNYFRNITPEDTGNAKRKTKKEGTDTIFANYAYAKRLDQGYSRQAPDGMSKPMFAEIRKYLKG